MVTLQLKVQYFQDSTPKSHEGLVKCTRDLIETNSKLIGPRAGFGGRPLCNAGGKPDLTLAARGNRCA